MKTNFTILCILLVCIATARPPKKNKSKTPTPPGTICLKDSLYMDQGEVRNLDYLEYLMWLAKNDNAAYAAALPDTAVWIDKSTYNEPYMNYYLRHPAYRNYPVVGVSYEQAVAYCKWRTDRVKEFSVIAKKPYAQLEYRLPTKKEWEYAASARNLDNNFGYGSFIGKNNVPKVWVKEVITLYVVPGVDIFVPESDSYSNIAGFYHMIGNVGEMIAEKGISKGGSAYTALYDCAVSNDQQYSKPTSYLGFRCVCIAK